MIKRIALPALAALALAGCGPTGPANTVAADNADVEANAVGNEAAPGNALAAVLGMSDRQRNVVFIRALLDADIACQQVTSSERLPDQDGKPLWRVNCSDKTAYMIGITPDGTANIVSRSDR
jgi:predicted small lipoprotein YifL